ncbi:MAG: hypothetical protein U1F46_08380 [Marinagarivorans sp.]
MAGKWYVGFVVWSRLIGWGVLAVAFAQNAQANTEFQDEYQSASDANKIKLFVSAESVTYAENISIDAWMDDLHTQDLAPGNTAFTRNYSQWGVDFGPIIFGGFARQDYYLHFSQDTFDLVYQDKNHIPYEANRRYDIHLDVSHVQTHGLKVGYDLSPFNSLNARLIFNYFDAEEVLFGELNGYLQSTNGKINGDLVLDYNYTKDVVLGRSETPPATGRGQSIDAEILWHPLNDMSLHLLVEDAYSQIKWSQSPYTEATITTVRTIKNRDGSVRRAPTISGVEWFRQARQTIPRHAKAEAIYQLMPAFEVELSQERIDNITFNRLMARYKMGSYFKLGLGYDQSASAARVELNSPYLSLTLSADSTDEKKAKFIAFSALAHYAF